MTPIRPGNIFGDMGVKEVFNLVIELLRESKAVSNFALIGKLALIPQVPSITSTLDIDFMALIENFEIFKEELKAYGFQTEEVKLPNGGMLIRFWQKETRVPVDVFEAKEAWQERIVRDALWIDFMGQRIPIARKEGILALKIAFYRDFKDREPVKILLKDPQLDRAYLNELLEQAGLQSKLATIARRVGVEICYTENKSKKMNTKLPPSFSPGHWK